MENFSPNWMALVAAAISALVIGFLWYNPKTFGTIWMKESGMTEEKAKSMNPAKTYGLAVIFAFLAATYLWMNVIIGGPDDMRHGTEAFMTFKHGALHGSMFAFCFILPVFATNALFEQKSFKYVAINVGYWIVTFAVMGGIVNAWT